jgi:8-oxo-dGTP diphosphatase
LHAVAELSRWRFCPVCGAEIVVEDEARAECSRCGFRAWASSKPTACAVVVESGRVLLARRAGEPFRGYWDLPGGFLEEGEHPLDGIRRELREETGLDIEPLEFIGVWMDRYGDAEDAHATLNLYWTARVLGGEARAADDVTELRWFGAEELPLADELAFHVADVLAAWREQHA